VLGKVRKTRSERKQATALGKTSDGRIYMQGREKEEGDVRGVVRDVLNNEL